MTKTQFLNNYRESLLAEMPWAQDATRLDRFMQSVERTIKTTASTWNHDSAIATRLWRTAGFKGKPTLNGLRALPE